MKAEEVIDIQSARNLIKENQIQNVKIAVTDCDGLLRGKYIQKKKFYSALENGFSFCDVIFGWDSNDVLYGNDSFTGWNTAFPDAWEFLAMVAASCNSYTRLIPGFWAPTAASWGLDNRTCAIRAIPGSTTSQRVEYRISAADINPYLAFAAAIGSGLGGVENKIEPNEPIAGNAYAKEYDEALKLPSTLSQAAGRLKASDPARDLFGDQFVDHFAYTQIWEDQQQRKAITDWQLNRYFEII